MSSFINSESHLIYFCMGYDDSANFWSTHMNTLILCLNGNNTHTLQVASDACPSKLSLGPRPVHTL